MASAAEELENCTMILSRIVLHSDWAWQNLLEFIVDRWSPPKEKEKCPYSTFLLGYGARGYFKILPEVAELLQAATQTCFLLISPPFVFSLRNYTDRRPSRAVAAGAGAYAERLSRPGPGGDCCAERDLSSETAEAWIGPARISAAARCLGAQTGLSDQLWVVGELLSSDFLSHEPTRTVKSLKLLLC